MYQADPDQRQRFGAGRHRYLSPWAQLLDCRTATEPPASEIVRHRWSQESSDDLDHDDLRRQAWGRDGQEDGQQR